MAAQFEDISSQTTSLEAESIENKNLPEKMERCVKYAYKTKSSISGLIPISAVVVVVLVVVVVVVVVVVDVLLVVVVVVVVVVKVVVVVEVVLVSAVHWEKLENGKM